MLDVESPPPVSRGHRTAQEKKLRKRKDLDALIVKGGRRKRGVSQELLSRSGDSSSDGEREDNSSWRSGKTRGVVWGLKWGVVIGAFLGVLVLVMWLHLNLRIELDQVRRHVNRGTYYWTFFDVLTRKTPMISNLCCHEILFCFIFSRVLKLVWRSLTVSSLFSENLQFTFIVHTF